MFARITSFKFDPARAAEVDSRTDEISLGLRQIPGLLHSYTVRDNGGDGVAVAIWESEQAAQGATSSIAQVWSKVGDLLTSPPQAKTYPVVNQLK